MIRQLTGWWFGTFFVFPYIGNFIIPTDDLIFFRGVGIPPTRLITHNYTTYFSTSTGVFAAQFHTSSEWVRRRNGRQVPCPSASAWRSFLKPTTRHRAPDPGSTSGMYYYIYYLYTNLISLSLYILYI